MNRLRHESSLRDMIRRSHRHCGWNLYKYSHNAKQRFAIHACEATQFMSAVRWRFMQTVRLQFIQNKPPRSFPCGLAASFLPPRFACPVTHISVLIPLPWYSVSSYPCLISSINYIEIPVFIFLCIKPQLSFSVFPLLNLLPPADFFYIYN